MKRVYINYHPNYDYAMAIMDGFIDLREYVCNTDWLCWAPSQKSQRQIMISRVRGISEGDDARPERVSEFVKVVERLGAEVLARNERGDEWQRWVEFSENLNYNTINNVVQRSHNSVV